MRDLLKELGGRFPKNQGEYDELVSRLRLHYHFQEHFPGTINDALHPRGRYDHAHHRRRTQRRHGYLNSVDESDALLAGDVADPWDVENPSADFYDFSGASDSSSSRPEGPGAAVQGYWNDSAWSYTSDGSLDYNDDADISATDTETISSLADVEYDWHDLDGLTAEQQEHEIFWQYQRAKKRYRRFSRKPNRRVRRHFRKIMRRKGKGRGKGRKPGRHLSYLIAKIHFMDTVSEKCESS